LAKNVKAEPKPAQRLKCFPATIVRAYKQTTACNRMIKTDDETVQNSFNYFAFAESTNFCDTTTF
jgi:hypothetical protein